MISAMLLLASQAGTVFYVSEGGNDGGSGSQGQPFKTLARAQQELKRLRSGGNTDPVTLILSGTLRLQDTLTLGPEFSNTTVRGNATITGGTDLTAWRPVKFNNRDAWEATTPDKSLHRQLFVGIERRSRARLPKRGFYTFKGFTEPNAKFDRFEGQTDIRVDPGQFRRFSNLKDIDIVAYHNWNQSRMGVADVDEGRGVVRFDRKSHFRLTDDKSQNPAPYRLENVAEALDEPGEWISEPGNRRVVYLPRPGESRESFKASVGNVPILFQIKGASRVTLDGLEFRHTEYEPPKNKAGDNQGANSVPGAISIDGGNDCVVRRCTVRNVGTYGIEVLSGNNNRIEGNEVTDLGAGGIKIWHDSTRTTVTDNRVLHGGRIYASGIGIVIGDTGNNVVSHNLVQDFFYTGITVGWKFKYGESKGKNNLCEFNDVRDIGQGEMNDLAGIYTLGESPGTIVRNNRVRNVSARGYGGWGIYLDNASSYITVENNLVQDTKSGSFHQHYGMQNVVRNNVLMNAKSEGQIVRTNPEKHLSFTFTHNVVVWRDTELLDGNYQNGDFFRFDRNVYHRTDGGEVMFRRRALRAWQREGQDVNSFVGDPQMTVTDSGVSFASGSPALRLGIKPIDLSTVGPRQQR